MYSLEELELKARCGAFSIFDMQVFVPEVRKLKVGQVYVEVGVDKGKSLSIARMSAKIGVIIYGIDLKENPGVNGTIFMQYDSTKVFLGKKVDLIFIDGDHTYEGCSADIANWYPQMKKHGVMLFHDYDITSPGVIQAVDEFAKAHKLKVDKPLTKRYSLARIKL